uniref:Uncharacterized protein n=1 Tax=Anguilla anguilla TaxID=7936 RepID=A0A0E9WXM6_ANGAN
MYSTALQPNETQTYKAAAAYVRQLGSESIAAWFPAIKQNYKKAVKSTNRGGGCSQSESLFSPFFSSFFPFLG